MTRVSGRVAEQEPEQASGLPAETGMKLVGLVLIVAAYFMFACLDTSAKYLAATLAPLQIVWMRFLTHCVFAFAAFRPWQHPVRFRPRHPLLQTLRALCLGGATFFNFFAVKYLQLAETSSIFFLAPFIVTALAGPLLGEWAGPRRWAAICVGFVGALFIIEPGPTGFQPAMLLSVCATLSYSFYIILTRHLTLDETAESMTLLPAVILALIMTPVGLLVWQPVPDAWHWTILLATGFFGGFGHWVLIKAHEKASASTLAPFLYLQLIWMVMFGYLVFGDIPGQNTAIGAAVIVASGLYLFRREKQKKVEISPPIER
jgi:drug/metabolite transporter (DMT)-like permease